MATKWPSGARRSHVRFVEYLIGCVPYVRWIRFKRCPLIHFQIAIRVHTFAYFCWVFEDRKDPPNQKHPQQLTRHGMASCLSSSKKPSRQGRTLARSERPPCTWMIISPHDGSPGTTNFKPDLNKPKDSIR